MFIEVFKKKLISENGNEYSEIVYVLTLQLSTIQVSLFNLRFTRINTS